jgi:C-terminal processing protease CtpA/Prc
MFGALTLYGCSRVVTMDDQGMLQIRTSNEQLFYERTGLTYEVSLIDLSDFFKGSTHTYRYDVSILTVKKDSPFAGTVNPGDRIAEVNGAVPDSKEDWSRQLAGKSGESIRLKMMKTNGVIYFITY